MSVGLGGVEKVLTLEAADLASPLSLWRVARSPDSRTLGPQVIV